MTCDLALFNFDGTDLDAGTVVEFMFAKFLDIPAVLLRTDFRAAGDQPGAGDAWNLMCSFYPRTKVVQLNAMAWYQQARHAGGTLHEVTQRLCQRLAVVVVENLDAVRRELPLAKGPPAEIERLYHWALRFPGSGFETYGAAPAFITQLVERQEGVGIVFSTKAEENYAAQQTQGPGTWLVLYAGSRSICALCHRRRIDQRQSKDRRWCRRWGRWWGDSGWCDLQERGGRGCW